VSVAVGSVFASFPSYLSTRMEAEFVDIDEAIFRLRRRKDPDELAKHQWPLARWLDRQQWPT
jgi:hypothetical protein